MKKIPCSVFGKKNGNVGTICSWRLAGKGHDRGKEARERENPTRQPQDAWGSRVGSKPQGSEAVGR